MSLSFPWAPRPGFGALAATARPTGAQRIGQLRPQAATALQVERLVDRLVRHPPVWLIRMLQAQPVRDLLRRVPQPQAPLDLPREIPIDRETTRLRPARTPACRPLRDDGPVTAAAAVPGDLPRHGRHRTAKTLRDTGQAPTRRDPQRELLTLLQRQSCTRHQHPPARGPSTGIQRAQCCNHRLRPGRKPAGVILWRIRG